MSVLLPVAEHELVRSAKNKTGYEFVTETSAGRYQLKPTLVKGTGQTTLGTFSTALRAAEAWVRRERDGVEPVSDTFYRKQRGPNVAKLQKVAEAGGGGGGEDDDYLRFCSRGGMRKYLALCELGCSHDDAYEETHWLPDPEPTTAGTAAACYTPPVMPPAPPVAPIPMMPLLPIRVNSNRAA